MLFRSSGRLLGTNSALVQLVANEGLLRTNALAAQLAQLLTTSNALNAGIAAVTPQLLGASNVFSGSNTFTGAVTATNGNNQFTGAFAGNGAGLSNVTAAGVSAANVSGLLSSGQLPGDVVYLAQLLATNAALRAQAAADLASASNGLSGRLLDTNSALVQLVANEGLLRTNALAAQFRSEEHTSELQSH